MRYFKSLKNGCHGFQSNKSRPNNLLEKEKYKMVSNNTRSGLPREVWRWLLGLDLPIAVTNPRRDFQNGENIATILNHYCGRNQVDRKSASKIEISFFNRGTSLKSLEANWDLIRNFLGKKTTAQWYY